MAASPYSVVTGRIISVTNIARFIGDVAEEAYAYAIEPESAPGTAIMAIGSSDRACGTISFEGQVYVFTLQKHQMAFGLQNDNQRALMSD